MTVNRMLCTLLVLLAPVAPGSSQDKPAPVAGRRPVKKPADIKFLHDTFTFVRIRYADRGAAGGFRKAGAGGRWATDYPDSDMNLTARVAADTGLKAGEPRVLQLTDADLARHPFIYIVEPGMLEFSGDEVQALRKYLLGGGFLMVDDFWGDAQWDNFKAQFERVFPDRPLKELPIEHPVFHCFYDLNEKPQVPSIHFFLAGAAEVDQPAHYRGVSDDKGRLMALVCHNTDLGDGWEREGESPEYFQKVSQWKAYPMGVNIVMYALSRNGEPAPPSVKAAAAPK